MKGPRSADILVRVLYLNPLDHERVKRGWEMVRYADDLVVLCRTGEEAEEAMAYLRDWSGRAAAVLILAGLGGLVSTL